MTQAMSHWEKIKAAHLKLYMTCRDEGDIASAWKAFEGTVKGAAEKPPYHLHLVMDMLDELADGKRKSKIRILDHGCGGSLTLLYLLTSGYEEIHGVDIGGYCESLNRLLNGHLGLKKKRFFVYDGRQLPFEDDSFDFIFSSQVVEHIRSNVLENYYAEEGRTLVSGGMAYHQVPHRLAPYDSHTRTWFIHYLPRNIWLSILRILGQDMTVPEQALFLRWPWVHRELAKRYLGSCEDRTMKRFIGLSDMTDYDGPTRLRRLLGQMLRIPVVRDISGLVLKNFVMLDTVSRKPLSATSGVGQAVLPK